MQNKPGNESPSQNNVQDAQAPGQINFSQLHFARGPPSDPSQHQFTRMSYANNFDGHPAELPKSQHRPIRNGTQLYSNARHIPTLPRRSTSSSNSGAVSLMKAFSSEHIQFSETGKLPGNFAACHQTYMNHCQTLQLSKTEALNDLHVLFKPNSIAAIFYHEHVISVAKKSGSCILYDFQQILFY